MGKPLVSVIIPTYNRSNLLKRAIDSVLQQTYPHLECIVVDDASTDDTAKVIEEFEDERLTYIRHEENKHVSSARNTGISRANGEYLAFLDDDDEWLPPKLEKQVRKFENADPKVGLLYCWMDFYEGENLIQQRHPKLRGDIFKETLSSQPIGNASTLLVKNKIAKEIGGFDTKLPRGNDGDFIRRICFRYEVDYVPEVLVKYYVNHGNQRITRGDEKGIRKNILGQEVKLQKFPNLQETYPKQYSNILVNIASSHLKLREYRRSSHILLKAFKAYPLNINIYYKFLSFLLKKIKFTK